jgi:general secretion pathway protein G
MPALPAIFRPLRTAPRAALAHRPRLSSRAWIKNQRAARGGFTLIEVLMVVTVLAIIAGVVVPQVTTVIDEAKSAALIKDLRELTHAIERYRMEHNGGPPDLIQNQTLIQLLEKTDAEGNVGTGPEFTYGPYVTEIPKNPLNGVSRVFRVNTAPPSNLNQRVGWVYHPDTGQIWAGLFNQPVNLADLEAQPIQGTP